MLVSTTAYWLGFRKPDGLAVRVRRCLAGRRAWTGDRSALSERDDAPGGRTSRRRSCFYLPVQGACDLVRAVAVVVHGPHGEEGGHALADRHNPHVVPEREAAGEREDEVHPENACG